MIHYLNSLSITEKSYESMQPSGNDLRFAAIESNLAEYTQNYAAWHWHEYVEFAYIVDGAVDCCVPGKSLVLREGEGYFVNANVLHMNRMSAGSSTARFRILQFDTSILTCTGVLAKRYVNPVLKAAELPCVAFSPKDPAHHAILAELEALFQTARSEPRGYELEIVQRLFRLWQRFYCLTEAAIGRMPIVQDNQSSRIKAMLTYIHAHYSEHLSVSDIGASANISEREAYRTFRQVLGTTPANYIQQYRVNCASRLLTETDDSVTEIAMECGFSSPNYFCMAFKETTGLPPREFRKRRS